MLTDVAEHQSDPRPVRSSLTNDAGVDLFRPVRPNGGIPRLLRRLVGVKEDILDWVPEERPRYTRLGAIVLNTGILAGFSVVVALRNVVGGHWWLLPIAAVVWMVVIITVDSWLISSTHGVRRSSKLMYIPRVLLSVLLGVVIAEPLVLGVFHSSIETEIRDYRKGEIERYESRLKQCNPVSGELVPDPTCDGLRVVIKEGPRAVEAQLAQAIDFRDDLRRVVDGLEAKRAELERVARDECVGRSGPGLTGVAGNGPECERNKAQSDQFRNDSQLPKLQQDLIAAEQKVVELNGAQAQARSNTEQQINAGINGKVEEKRENLTNPGLLDEFEALGRLSDRHLIVFLAHVVLAMLLLALDCLPVLAKLMGGTTAYDHQVFHQVEVAKRLHNKHLRTNEKRDSVDLDIQMQRWDQKLRNRIEDIDGADRSAKERRRIELSAQIDRLAAALEQQGGNR
jgi:hypothetical protein